MLSASAVVPIFYLSLPIAAGALATWRAKKVRNANPIRDMLMTFVLGAVGGLIVAAVYMRRSGGEVPGVEVAVACYWGIAVACVVRGFNAVLKWGLARVTPSGANGRPCWPAAEVAGSVVRSVVLLAVVIPYVGAVLLIYRPHVVHAGTPTSILGVDYQPIAFRATDGVKIRGWWIPAAVTDHSDDPHASPASSTRTIILCHGLGGDKAADLRLVRDLIPNGFNVLAFDFRGHGQSDGQLTTYGDLERRDVLGAVRWVRENHPNESKRIFGIGEGMGAAALIAAAADLDEGQAIDAIAVFSPYNDVTHLIQDAADANYVPTVGWVGRRMALPIAGAQLGTSLTRFSPGEYVDKLAPRPLLVIGAEQDQTMDVSLSRDLYEQASQPKYAYWIKKGGRNSMLFTNRNASMALRIFFETARSVL